MFTLDAAELVDGIHAANRLAKSAPTQRERREWYAVKSQLLSDLIEANGIECVRFGYEWQADGTYLVLVTLFGRRSGTWHIPMEQLSVIARETIVRQLGPPSRQ
jgi:hypothetical protein